MALKLGLFVAFFVLATSFMVMAQLQTEIVVEYGADTTIKNDDGKTQAEVVGSKLVRSFTISSLVVVTLFTLFGRNFDRKLSCATAFAVSGVGLCLAIGWKNVDTLWMPFTVAGLGFHTQFALLTDMTLAAFKGKNKEIVLNRYYLIFASGFALGPLYLTWLVQEDKGGIACKTLFVIMATILLGFAAMVFFSKIKVEKHERTKRAEPLISMLLDYRLWVLGLSFIIYVGAEVSIDVWGKKYLIANNAFKIDNASDLAVWSGWMVSAFWAGMLTGRAFMGNVAKKLGLNRTLIAILLISAGFMTFATHVEGKLLVTTGFVLLGLAMAGVYALMFTIATDRFPNHPEDVVSSMVLFTSLGVVLLPQWFGLVGTDIGIGMGELAWAFPVLIIILIPVMIHRHRDEKLEVATATTD